MGTTSSCNALVASSIETLTTTACMAPPSRMGNVRAAGYWKRSDRRPSRTRARGERELDARQELVGRERLLYEVDLVPGDAMPRDHVVRVPRHEQHCDPGMPPGQAIGQILARHLGHHRVREQEVDLAAVNHIELERRVRAARLDDPVVALGEDPRRDPADGG